MAQRREQRHDGIEISFDAANHSRIARDYRNTR
jgi:hypothetical protein